VLARKPLMRPGRYCMRLSRVFTSAVSWPRLRLARLARDDSGAGVERDDDLALAEPPRSCLEAPAGVPASSRLSASCPSPKHATPCWLCWPPARPTTSLSSWPERDNGLPAPAVERGMHGRRRGCCNAGRADHGFRCAYQLRVHVPRRVRIARRRAVSAHTGRRLRGRRVAVIALTSFVVRGGLDAWFCLRDEPPAPGWDAWAPAESS
jgi:hypothetical protein